VRPFNNSDVSRAIVGDATANPRPLGVIDVNYVAALKIALNVSYTGGQQAPLLLL